ncbi:hypothetical protein [uncultured Agrobacterium sp.]|uniref:hypothetical protein n=1 Tax=uncultured Agrobacterium sp. TaxID=157277 RepID=UPI0025E13A30|nr:hypothetical protein [uncultured Agrobacterium sp.]
MMLNTFEENTDHNGDIAPELVSIARLVTYARNSAKDLHLEFSTYCLDLALGSLVEEIRKRGVVDTDHGDEVEYTPSVISGASH